MTAATGSPCVGRGLLRFLLATRTAVATIATTASRASATAALSSRRLRPSAARCTGGEACMRSNIAICISIHVTCPASVGTGSTIIDIIQVGAAGAT